MKLKRIAVKNFRCFDGNGVILDLSDRLTALIGPNSVGKTTIFEALLKVFSKNPIERVFGPEDFFSNSLELNIEVLLELPDCSLDLDCIFYEDTKNYILVDVFAFRLTEYDEVTSTFTYYGSLNKKEKLTIHVDGHSLKDEELKNVDFRKIDNNGKNLRGILEIFKLSTERFSLKDISQQGESLHENLTKFLKGKFSHEDKKRLQAEITKNAEKINSDINKVSFIEEFLEESSKIWEELKASSSIDFRYTPTTLDDYLEYLKITLDGKQIDELGDGEKSLIAILLMATLLEFHSKYLLSEGYCNLVLIEEPENHVSPQVLGRIVQTLEKIGEKPNVQVVLTTHSPSIIKRISPLSIRVMGNKKAVKRITETEVDLKYVRGAIQKYPELYFSRLIVLVEGDSEEEILPDFFKEHKIDIDLYNISVVPLGGRHVNHLWRLMEALECNYITLLDLDLGKSTGGWSRLESVVKDIKRYKKFPPYKRRSGHENLDRLLKEIHSYKIKEVKGRRNQAKTFSNMINIMKRLEKYNIYFSSPLDFDFHMLERFEKEYKTTINGEPKLSSKQAINKIFNLKTGKILNYTCNQQELFNWYNYLFLGEKGKPTIHRLAIEEIKKHNGWHNKLLSPFDQLVENIKKTVNIK